MLFLLSLGCFILANSEDPAFHLGLHCLAKYPVPEGDFILANSADPDEMQQNAALHLGLHCLSKYLFRGFSYTKG